MIGFRSAHILMRLPVINRRQKSCKTLFCQRALMLLVRRINSFEMRLHNSPHRHCADATFSVFLEEGANIQGLSLVQAKARVSGSKRLLIETTGNALCYARTLTPKQNYSLEFSLSEVVLVRNMSTFQCVIAVQRNERARRSNAEPRVVSNTLRMRYGSQVPSLQDSYRNAILSSLLGTDEIVNNVDRLPLPLMLRDYMLAKQIGDFWLSFGS